MNRQKEMPMQTQPAPLPVGAETQWVQGRESGELDWFQVWPVDPVPETESEARVQPNLPETPEAIREYLGGVRSESQGE